MKKSTTEALNDASIALGKAGGLADTLRDVVVDRQRDLSDVESILRVVDRLVKGALADVQRTVENAHWAVREAVAVSDLLLIDSEEVVESPRPWALETLVDLLHQAKGAVDDAADQILKAADQVLEAA